MEYGKSYYLTYRGDIINAFRENNISKYIILNNILAAIYVEESFDEEELKGIPEITWWNESFPMSSLVDITNSVKDGESITDAAGTDYIKNNPYVNVTGENTLIAIIDSGVDYLNKDLISKDGKSKILYLWDQESILKKPPEGMIYGSEFTNQEINEAIKTGDKSLSEDKIGTGTGIAGILVGQGNENKQHVGVAKGAELVVVKLKSYEGVYKEDRISYAATDFLAAITYVISIAKKEKKPMVINLTVGARSAADLSATILDTYPIFNRPGIIMIGGAGNQGNTDIHYSGNFASIFETQDVIIQNGENTNLDIVLSGNGPDKIGVQIISPSGELSQIVEYSPSDTIYKGRFNLENTNYIIKYVYPWITTGEVQIDISLRNIKPGIWTIRLIPEFIIKGNYNVYLPNKNLISKDTRFLDPNSMATITTYAVSDGVITVGAYNDRLNSIWIGSSKGDPDGIIIKPDIIAPGVNIISTYINGEYNTYTGTGVSSSIVSGIVALVIEYLQEQSDIPKLSLFNEVLKTYLMLGTTKKEIYEYPNLSQGYGIINLKNLFTAIANNI